MIPHDLDLSQPRSQRESEACTCVAPNQVDMATWNRLTDDNSVGPVSFEVPFDLKGVKHSTVLKTLKRISPHEAFVLQIQCVAAGAGGSTGDRAGEHVLCALQLTSAQLLASLQVTCHACP